MKLYLSLALFISVATLHDVTSTGVQRNDKFLSQNERTLKSGGMLKSKTGSKGCEQLVISILVKDLAPGDKTEATSGPFFNSKGRKGGTFIESIVATSDDCLINGALTFKTTGDQIFYQGTCSSNGDLLVSGGTGLYKGLGGRTLQQVLAPDEQSVSFVINPC